MTGLNIADILNESLGEDEIDFLERTLLCLGIEEIDDWNEGGVDDGEEQVCSPLDFINHDWDYHNYQKVEKPIELLELEFAYGEG